MSEPATGNGQTTVTVASGAAVPSPAGPATVPTSAATTAFPTSAASSNPGSDARRAAHDLAVAADRLVDQVAHWTPGRWAATPTGTGQPDGATRAELMYGLVQMLADLVAEAENRPRLAVPRLDNDLSLPDQFRVMVHDLIAATTDERPLRQAAALVNAARLAL